jgi:hypothetical protein
LGAGDGANIVRLFTKTTLFIMKQITLFICFFWAAFLPAQTTFPYNFSVSQGTYTPLVNAVSVNNGETWDDPNYSLPLGFNLQLFGSSFNNLVLSEFFAANAFSGGANPSPIILSYGTDLIDRGSNGNTSLSPISYKIEGPVGSKIFKLEYSNAGFYDDPQPYTSFINTQLWIYEGSNDIEIRFGPVQVSSQEVFGGFTGPIIGFFDKLTIDDDDFVFDNLYYLEGNVANPTIKTATLSDFLFLTQTLQGTPTNGTIYRFANNTVSTDGPQLSDQAIQVAPSITNDRFRINCTSEVFQVSDKVRYRVLNQLGQSVNEGWLTEGANNIDLVQSAAGIYVVQIMSEHNTLRTARVVKQ